MKVSIITPTNNERFLQQLYESIKAQAYQDWEWIICLNGDCSKVSLTDFDSYEPSLKIRFFTVPSEIQGIGAIKAWSFAQASGDILLEMDHDDLLPRNALSRIVEEFQKTQADFVYSNCCEFFGDSPASGSFHFFPAWQQNGWRYRTTCVDGLEISETISFKPSAAALATIYYAPNHLRAWKSDSYKRIGGHNPAYRICDDHELLIRTYLNGKMHHIDECLYFYRMHDNNTVKSNLDEIRKTTYGLYVENIEKLILREAELRGLKCYDLGGAINGAPGFLAVDNSPGADIQADLNKRWPFEDNSVFAFRAHDIFEHLNDKIHTMCELHRCLVPGGHALIQVPSALGQGAFQDPSHVSYWVENSFRYYTDPAFARFIGNTEQHFMCDRLFSWDLCGIPYVKAELRAIKGNMEGIPGVRLF